MKISTEISSAAQKVGEERAIELIAKAGFDAYDFSMFDMCPFDYGRNDFGNFSHPLAVGDHLAFARKLKRVADDCGIVCNQSHAPFPTWCEKIGTYIYRAIECTAEAGGEICVIHPDTRLTAKENVEMFMPFLEYAKSVGVKIACENMWGWDFEKSVPCPASCSKSEDFLAVLNGVNDPSFVACLDIGHAEIPNSGDGAVPMIHALGHHLQALHIHDTDRVHDNHQIPFSMNIDFEAVAKALKDIGYSGYLTLEADCYLSRFSPEDTFKGVCDLSASAKRIADMF